MATLAGSLLHGDLVPGVSGADDPLGLAAATIYVPTRRSAQALIEALAAAGGGTALLLPRILPIGHLDAELADTEDSAGTLDPDLPQAIEEIPRRILLTRLVVQWAEAVRYAVLSVDGDSRRRLDPTEPLLVAAAPADAWHLAGELAALIDELVIEDVDWSRFSPLGVGTYDEYWRITLDFLGVAMHAWPTVLRERGLVDRATRQAALVRREIARLTSGSDPGPIVIAGSTGTNRATAELMRAVARLRQGAVVLPGLDLTLDSASWEGIGRDGAAGHPQAALHRLLPYLGVAREDVRELGRAPGAIGRRARFLQEALRPAETTDLWLTRGARLADADVDAALAELAVIEASDERAEALAIAVALREALEVPGQAVALITPDRGLARRVRAELGRWDIAVEDSAGEPLGATPLGRLARLAAACAAGAGAGADVLALLAHPLARLGRRRGDLERLAEVLEIGVFRAVPATGGGDVAALVAAAREAAAGRHAHPQQRAIPPGVWAALGGLLDDLAAALRPLADLTVDMPLPACAEAHRTALLAVLRDPDGGATLAGPEGARLGDLFDTLAAPDGAALVFRAAGYAAFFDTVVAGIAVRGPRHPHPRVTILGLLEARLLAPDVVVLGGLDETIWPPQPRTDAFLNRPMRAELGLTPPERRIGQTAHDLVSALGARRAVLSRATKRGGSPTVASRFLQRMAALAGDSRWAACRARGERYLAWAAALDRPVAPERIGRPEPRPAAALRPRQLSVTRIETLRRDPYAIYAESILRLRPLEPVGVALDARGFGTALHKVIGDFTIAYPGGVLPADMTERLLASVRQVFAQMLEDADFAAFQRQRIWRNMTFFADWEAQRRDRIDRILAEVRGELDIPLRHGSSFKLTAEADRIEIGRDGSLAIIDYKTGTPPGKTEVRIGFAPQLTLEAAMATRGAFPGIPAGAPVTEALYLRLGSSLEGGKKVDLKWQECSLDDVVERHYRGLVDLLEIFADEANPYIPRPYPKFASKFGAYDHLARVKEWSATGGTVDAEP